MTVTVRVPGSTSNLGSGFDVVGLALRLYLTVTVDEAAIFEIVCSGRSTGAIPCDKNNHVYKALRQVFEKAGKPVPALKIKIENEIPLYRGLGSSGAATIAGLMCGNDLAQAGLTRDDILTLAADFEGHPENASASLLGGLTINCIQETRVITRKIVPDARLLAVLIIPKTAVPTHEARQILPKALPFADAIFNLQRCALLTESFQSRDYSALRVAMQDRLHQPYRRTLFPAYEKFESAALENDALGFCISGSGSTMLAFCLGDAKRLALALQETATRQAVEAEVRVVKIDREGARFR